MYFSAEYWELGGVFLTRSILRSFTLAYVTEPRRSLFPFTFCLRSASQ